MIRKTFFRVLNTLGTHYKWHIIGLFVAAIIAGVLEVGGLALIFPLIAMVTDVSIVEDNPYLAHVYEFMGFTSPSHMIYFVALSIGLIFIFKNIYMMYFHYAQLSLLKRWRKELAERIMRKYLQAPFMFHLERSSNNMINTLNYTVFSVLNMFMLPSITFMSLLVVLMILLIFIMAQFFWASIISGGILLVVSYAQSQFIKHMSNKISSQANKPRAVNLAVLAQAVGAIKETKSYNRERYFEGVFSISNERVSAFDRKSTFIQMIPPYITEMTLVGTIIIMCCLVLSQTYSPLDGVTSLAILAAVAFRMAPMINRALFAYSQIRVSVVTAQDLLSELDSLDILKPELPETAADEKITFGHVLTLEHVDFHYNRKETALHDVSLMIHKGEFVGIVGASGAGKTTLVDMLLGLLPPERGEYRVDDTLITVNNLQALRRLMGYVSQSPYIFNATVRENVAFGVALEDIDDAKVTKALQMAQIDAFFRTKEDYIHTPISDGGKSLSGGQRQRLAIARALYHDPQIIVLDEATSALDVETEHEITQVINNLKGEKTIIAIAHRLSTLKKCDRVIYMEDGRICDIGTFRQLSAKHKRFARLLELSSPETGTF